jgi:hypothetical protein
MNKKLLLTWVAVFVVWFLGSYLIHGVLLSHDYGLMQGLFRPMDEQQKYFSALLLGQVIFAGAFVWIYARGVEAKPWLPQGVRYGIAVTLLAIVPTYLIYFAVQPVPESVMLKQIIFDGILAVIVAIIAAWMYRSEPARA